MFQNASMERNISKRFHVPNEKWTHRQHEAELRQSREECWAREQELAALREKLTSLKTTLDDRRKDVVSYKVGRLCTACSLHFFTNA